MLSPALKLESCYAAEVKFVQVVEPFVFTYKRVAVDEPAVFTYNEPLAADIVGAPEPTSIWIPPIVMPDSNTGFVPDGTVIIFLYIPIMQGEQGMNQWWHTLHTPHKGC